MSSPGAPAPLVYERIGHDALGVVADLELDPDQVERFLGPIQDIQDAVRKGPAHAMVAIRAQGTLVGFYVLHPDRRDAACWWLGWLALDRRQQGHGFGRTTLSHIMASLGRLAGCRRVRLLVAPDNGCARRLYEKAGFRAIGCHVGGELILEAALSADAARVTRPAATIRVVVRPGHASRQGRLRLNAGPYAARMIGVQRGPPAAALLAAMPGDRRPAVRPTAPAARHPGIPRTRSAPRPPAARAPAAPPRPHPSGIAAPRPKAA